MNTKGNNEEETIEESPQGQQVIFQLIKVSCILRNYQKKIKIVKNDVQICQQVPFWVGWCCVISNIVIKQRLWLLLGFLRVACRWYWQLLNVIWSNMMDYAENISHYPNCQHGFKFFLKLNASLLFMLTICNSEDHFCWFKYNLLHQVSS